MVVVMELELWLDLQLELNMEYGLNREMHFVFHLFIWF